MGKQIAERQQEMIAVAAYYRAERRGFREGDPVTDWLEAEVEIEQLLQAPANLKSAKQSFQDKLEAQLEEWDNKLDELKSRAGEAKLKARAELDKRLEVATHKRAAAEAKLKELRKRSEIAWEDLKDGTLTVWDDLREAIERVAARFK